MSSHRSRRTEQLRDAPRLLEAMGRCRKAVLDAQDSVKPFGVVFHGCGMVTAAIDALAYLVTGQPHYYSVAGSVAPPSPYPSGAMPARPAQPAASDLQARGKPED